MIFAKEFPNRPGYFWVKCHHLAKEFKDIDEYVKPFIIEIKENKNTSKNEIWFMGWDCPEYYDGFTNLLFGDEIIRPE